MSRLPDLTELLTEANVSIRQPAPTPAELEFVSCWLVSRFDDAVMRLTKPRVKFAEAKALMEVHDAFLKKIGNLQGRRNPPPTLPGSEEPVEGEEPTQTEWERWWAPFYFEREGGRPLKGDRQLVADLLAAYEVLTGQTASLSKEQGPTIRFLDLVYTALQNRAGVDDEGSPGLPGFETLRKEAMQHRGSYARLAARRLTRDMVQAGVKSQQN